MIRRIAAVLVLVCACACSAPAASVPRRAPTALPTPPPTRAWRVVAAPYFGGSPWRLDTTHVVWGGLRLEVRGEEVEVAASFAAPVVAATELEDGWLFLTLDGLLARSSTFVGPLEIVERRGGLGSVAAALGSVVVVADRELLVSEGGPFTRRELSAPIVDAAFRGAWGLVIFDGGALLETRDAGETWTELERAAVPSERPGYGRSEPAALDLALHPAGGFAVMRSDGAHRRTEHGWERAPWPEPRAGSEEIDETALERAAARVRLIRLDETFRRRLIGTVRPDGCSPTELRGTVVFARCLDRDSHWWERWQPGHPPRRLDGDGRERWWVSSDGDTVLFEACGSGEPCAYLDGEPRAIAVSFDEVDVLAVGAGHVLLASYADDAPRFALLDVRTGERHALRLSPAARAMMSAETTYVAGTIGSSPTAPRPYVTLSFRRPFGDSWVPVLVAGDSTGPLELILLPPGTTAATGLGPDALVAFVDGLMSVFVGTRAEALRLIPIHRAGGATDDELEQAVNCDGSACRYGARAIGWDLEDGAELGGGARFERGSARVIDLSSIRLIDDRALDCPDLHVAQHRQVPSVLSDIPNAQATRAVVDGTERWTWRVDGGPIRRAESPRDPDTLDEETWYSLARATDRYALLVECRHRGCEALVLHADGRVERIPAPPFTDRALSTHDDGNTLLLLSAEGCAAETVVEAEPCFPRSNGRYQVALWLAPDGSVARVVTRRGAPLLMAHRGAPGLAERVHGGIRFHARDGSVQVIHSPRTTELLQPCRSPGSPAALLVEGEILGVVRAGEHRLPARPWYEVTQAGSCLRWFAIARDGPLVRWPSRIEWNGGWQAVERHAGRERRADCDVAR